MPSLVLNKQLKYATLVRNPVVQVVLLIVVCSVYGLAIAQSAPIPILIGAPLAVAVVIAALAKPELAAIVLIGLEYHYLSDVAVKFHGTPSLSQPLTLLLLLGLLVRRFTGQRVRWVYDPITWLMAAYLFVTALGLLYARDYTQALGVTNDFAKNFLLYLLIINLITDSESVERSLWLLLGIGAVLATLTVYQEITHNYETTFGGLARMKVAQIADGLRDRPRAGGTTSEPLAYGQQLLILVPVGLWGFINGRMLRTRVLAGYATLACLVGISLTFSRSTYIALAVTLLLFLLFVNPNRRQLLLLLPLLVGLLWIAPPELTARFATLENLFPNTDSVNLERQGINSDPSYRMRSIQLEVAMDMFADHPVLGVGGGNFSVWYGDYIRERGELITEGFGPPHNFLLHVAVEHGLVGLVIVGAVLVLTMSRLRTAYRLFKLNANQRMAELSATLQVSFVGYFISALFLHLLYSRFLWLQVALAVALARVAAYQAKQSLPIQERETDLFVFRKVY